MRIRFSFYKALNTLFAAAMLSYILLLFYTAYFQIRYPFILEWIEGAMMDHVTLLLKGRSIYTTPEAEFVSSPYAPFYFHLGQFFSMIFSPSIAVLRSVSAVFTIVIFLTLFFWVKLETSSNISGILSVFLFALSYQFVSEWFFLARVDMTAIALFALSALILRFSESYLMLVFSGLLIYLSIITKQSGLFLFTGMVFSGIFLHRRRILIFIFSCIIPLVVTVIIYNATTDGWFFYLTWVMPSNHGIIETRYLSFFTSDIFPKLLPFVVSGIIFLIHFKKKKPPQEFLFYLFFAGTLFFSSYLGRIKVGGATNAFIPLIFGGSIFIPVIISQAQQSRKLFIVYAVAAMAQISFFMFNPLQYIPDRKMYSVERKLVDFMKKSKGTVWLMNTGYLSTVAGKGVSSHLCLVDDLLTNKIRQKEFSKMLSDSFKPEKFDMVIVNEKKVSEPFKKTLKKDYIKTKQKFHITKWLGSRHVVFEEVHVFKRKDL